MFFFFVGGVEQQAGRVVTEAAGRCLRCGSTADLVEVEKVLKLFFVPVWRWPSKAPAYYCRSRDCSFLSPHSLSLSDDGRKGGLLEAFRCRSCSSVVDPEFRFCPYCGSAL